MVRQRSDHARAHEETSPIVAAIDVAVPTEAYA